MPGAALSLPSQMLPWWHFTSPVEKWAAQPSFVVGEYLFIALAAIALVHAFRQPVTERSNERRAHLLVWFAAILAGTANDLIFMALPLVDNFWQAQATLMITARLPFYIPCVYVCFMYYPAVAVRRLGLPPLARAMATGLAAIVFYAPYDIVGARFLWWTWHDTDPPIANRLLGAPLGSTMWVIVFVTCFAWLVGRAIDRDPALHWKRLAIGFSSVVALTTLLMMLVMAPLQQLDGGVPGPRGLLLLVTAWSLVAWRGWRVSRRASPSASARSSARASDRSSDWLLHRAVLVYFATLVAIVAIFDPRSHRSASLHQTYGPCDVEATDSAGHIRRKYICASDYDEDFRFDCAPTLPSDGDRWYTVCGRPHAGASRYVLGVSALAVIGSLLYAWLYGEFARRNSGQNQVSKGSPDVAADVHADVYD